MVDGFVDPTLDSLIALVQLLAIGGRLPVAIAEELEESDVIVRAGCHLAGEA